jgi:protein TonB
MLAVAFVAVPAFADDYDTTVKTQIAKNIEYPRIAKMKQIEGKVGYAVTIDAGGKVSDASVEATSNSPMLDDATIAAIKKAAPFPAPAAAPHVCHGIVSFKLD